jgi:cytochrome c5
MKKIIMLTAIVAAATAYSASGADAKTVYEENCAKCHGTDG